MALWNQYFTRPSSLFQSILRAQRRKCQDQGLCRPIGIHDGTAYRSRIMAASSEISAIAVYLIPPHHFRRLSSAPRTLYGQFPITEEFCHLSYPQSSTHPLYANRLRRSSPSCLDPSLSPYTSINRRPESASVHLRDSGSRISRPMLVYCNAHQSTASAGL